jgi:Protein of unknown function (DUF3037)
MPQEPSLKECGLYLVRYVPNPVRGESLNVGVLLYCRERKYLGCLFQQNLGRIRNFHAQVDTQFFRELQRHFERQIEEHQNNLDAFLQEIQNYSNMIQIDPPQKCIVDDPRAEILRLYERHVA